MKINKLPPPRKFTITGSQSEQTKTTLNGVQILWANGDKLGVANGDATTYEEFTLINGAGTKNGTFTGNELKPDTYVALYPYQRPAPTTPDSPFFLTGQKQTGASNDHLGKYDFLYSDPVKIEKSAKTADFFFHHALSLHELKISLSGESKLTDVKVTQMTFVAHKADETKTPVHAFSTGIYYNVQTSQIESAAQSATSVIDVTDGSTLSTDQPFSVFTVLDNVKVADQYPYQVDLTIAFTYSGGSGTYTQANIRTIDGTTEKRSEYQAGVKYTNNTTSIGIDVPAAQYFPDANFRAYLKETYGLVETNGDIDPTSETNKSKIEKITVLNIPSKNISSLKGIEYCTAMIVLVCIFNQLTDLDVSKNIALQDLLCGSNQLTTLDVSKNKELNQLLCYSNPLTSLNLSNNTMLTILQCNSNGLTSLDVSKNTALKTLLCHSNQLASLNVSTNIAITELRCYSNQLTSLDVSTNTALKTLLCYSNQLTGLDLTTNIALNSLSCYDNQLPSLDIRNLSKLSIELDKYMICGNQKPTKTIQLTLTQTQKTTKWDPYWSSNANNTRVDLNIQN